MSKTRLVIVSLTIVCSSSSPGPIDELSFVQTALITHARKPVQQRPQTAEDLLYSQFKQEDISGIKLANLVPSQTTYKWGQRLSSYELAEHHTNSSVAWISPTAERPSKQDPAAEAKNFHIKAFHPTGDGPFPLYLSINGDYCEYDGGAMLDMVRYMAERGYFSAAVEYDNGRFCADFCETSDKCKWRREDGYYTDHHHYFNSTTSEAFFGAVTLFEKARGVKNALDVLCGTASVDCSKGVAVSGFSQGAWVGSALGLIDSRISAMLLFGIGLFGDFAVIHHPPGHELVIFKQDCMEDENLSKHVPRSKRRYLDGMLDSLVDPSHDALAYYSGYWCDNTSSPIDCIQPDGSGYYMVAPGQYSEADKKSEKRYPTTYVGGLPMVKTVAGHNFFSDTRPIDKEGKLLPSFKHGTEPWCFKPSFGWLAKAALTSEGGADAIKGKSQLSCLPTFLLCVLICVMQSRGET